MCAEDLYKLIYFACEEWEAVHGEKQLKESKGGSTGGRLFLQRQWVEVALLGA